VLNKPMNGGKTDTEANDMCRRV